MPTYNTKPTQVEARQWDEGTRAQANDLIAWIQDGGMLAYFDTSQFPDAVYIVINTKNGPLHASPGQPSTEPPEPGDWIVKGAGGEFSVYKPDVFAASFDPA